MESVCVGIDVSADELEVAYRDRNGSVGRVKFENTSDGHRALIRLLRKQARSARVVVEATGIYSLDLCFALDPADGVEVMVANPRARADFAKALLQRSKTDRADAAMILAFCERMPFAPWQRPSTAAFELRAISRRIHALNALIRAEKSRDHIADHLEALPAVIEQSVQQTIRLLERQIEKLRRAALDVIEQDIELTERFELLLSVKGIAAVSALSILSELALLAADMTPSQWVAHA